MALAHDAGLSLSCSLTYLPIHQMPPEEGSRPLIQQTTITRPRVPQEPRPDQWLVGPSPLPSGGGRVRLIHDRDRVVGGPSQGRTPPAVERVGGKSGVKEDLPFSTAYH